MKEHEGELKKKYCLLCEKEVDRVIDIAGEHYRSLRQKIKKSSGEWKGETGACGRCLALYEKRE